MTTAQKPTRSKKPALAYTLPCGCTKGGGRCDTEGILYAALEAARNRLIVEGVNIADPDALASLRGPYNRNLVDDLDRARRNYAAHFAQSGQYLQAGQYQQKTLLGDTQE